MKKIKKEIMIIFQINKKISQKILSNFYEKKI